MEQGNFAEDEACQQMLLKKPRLRIVWAVVETSIGMHLHGKNGSALCTCRPLPYYFPVWHNGFADSGGQV